MASSSTSSATRPAPLPPSPLASPTRTVAVPIVQDGIVQQDRLKFFTDVESGRLRRVSRKENKCFSCLSRYWKLFVTMFTVLVILAVVFRPAITNLVQNRYQDDGSSPSSINHVAGASSSANRLPIHVPSMPAVDRNNVLPQPRSSYLVQDEEPELTEPRRPSLAAAVSSPSFATAYNQNDAVKRAYDKLAQEGRLGTFLNGRA